MCQSLNSTFSRGEWTLPISKRFLLNLYSPCSLCTPPVSIPIFARCLLPFFYLFLDRLLFVLCRLFAPWSMLMKNFKKLTFHPGYMASATFENVKTILSKHKEKPGRWALAFSSSFCPGRIELCLSAQLNINTIWRLCSFLITNLRLASRLFWSQVKGIRILTFLRIAKLLESRIIV